MTFHRDFEYDHTRWRDNLVLESREGIRFHFSAQNLIDASGFFAGAPVPTPPEHEQPVPGHGRLQAIPLSFASSTSLRYLLIVLHQISTTRKAKTQRLPSMDAASREPLWSITIQSVRIAEILDAPNLARKVLERSGLDAYHRFVVEDALAIRSLVPVDTAGSSRNGTTFDASFSLETDIQYKRCFDLLKELNPRGLDELIRVHHMRKAAISDTLRAWREPSTHLLKRACSANYKRVHDPGCNTRMVSVEAERDRFRSMVPVMMGVLATARTIRQRRSKIRAMLSIRVNGCRGCLDDLNSVYTPGLRIFQNTFPDEWKSS